MLQSPSNRIIIKGSLRVDNDSPFCLWVWEVEMSWMSPLLRMLSSLLGVCAGVVPAGSWEGRNPMCWALCVVPKDPNQQSSRASRGLGMCAQGWSNQLVATVGHPTGSPIAFAHHLMLMQLPQQEFLHALQVHAGIPAGTDPAGAEQASSMPL